MNKKNGLKIAGFICAAAAFGISMVQKQIDDKNLEKMIDERVQERLNEEN